MWCPDRSLVTPEGSGKLCSGDHRETFISLIGFWSPRDYEEQWTEGIARVVNGGVDSCLINSLHDPAAVEIIRWWLLYPVARTVHVQTGFLILAQQNQQFSTRDPYASIPPRVTIDEGQEVSELGH